MLNGFSDPGMLCMKWRAILEGVMEIDNIVVEGDQPSSQENCNQSQANLSFSETSTRVQIQVQAEEAGWLFLANVWYPGWNVYVDGKKEINNRADFLFQAAQVGEGNHTVEWRYEPKSWLVGACLSGFSLLIMVVWSCWPAIRNRFRRSLDK